MTAVTILTKHLASHALPLPSRPMKRLALSISFVVAALGFGACEPHSWPAGLPEHYQHKQDAKHAGGGHPPAAPAHEEKPKAPAGEHKG